ncbi:MAG: hypothetical protein ACHP8B_16670 [Terriglobales bacterium]
MDKATFLKEQYSTLRKEIENTKSRIFKIVAFGLTIVPAAHFVAQEQKLEALLYITPLLVIVVALLYLSENHALMRCGRYIRCEIERHVTEQDKDVIGWETWLEANKQRYGTRTVDKFVAYCFHILFVVYFAGSVYVAIKHALEAKMAVMGMAALLGVYVAVGIWFLIFLLNNIRTATEATDDMPAK